MTLRAKATDLCICLEGITAGLEAYDKDERSRYTKDLAAHIRPSVQRLKKAIEDRNREEAKDALAEITELMYEVKEPWGRPCKHAKHA